MISHYLGKWTDLGIDNTPTRDNSFGFGSITCLRGFKLILSYLKRTKILIRVILRSCFCAIRKTTHFCRKVFIEIVLYFVGVFTANTLFMSQTIKGHLHGLSLRLCLFVCCIYLDCTSVPPNNKGVETVYI